MYKSKELKLNLLVRLDTCVNILSIVSQSAQLHHFDFELQSCTSIIAIRLFYCSDQCDEEFFSAVGAVTVGLKHWQDIVLARPDYNTESVGDSLHSTRNCCNFFAVATPTPSFVSIK